MTASKRYASFSEFYPFYLSEHSTRVCKMLHYLGTTLVIATFVTVLITREWHQFYFLPLFGYGFAWIGHFVFEKNRPASFKQPFYSLRGDFVMFWDLLTGRLDFTDGATRQPS